MNRIKGLCIVGLCILNTTYLLFYMTGMCKYPDCILSTQEKDNFPPLLLVCVRSWKPFIPEQASLMLFRMLLSGRNLYLLTCRWVIFIFIKACDKKTENAICCGCVIFSWGAELLLQGATGGGGEQW